MMVARIRLWLLERLDALGYDGFVGCEYIPARGTREGLGWVAPCLDRARG